MKVKDICFKVNTPSGEMLLDSREVISFRIDGVNASISTYHEDGYAVDYEFPTAWVELVESND